VGARASAHRRPAARRGDDDVTPGASRKRLRAYAGKVFRGRWRRKCADFLLLDVVDIPVLTHNTILYVFVFPDFYLFCASQVSELCFSPPATDSRHIRPITGIHPINDRRNNNDHELDHPPAEA
jgi:hypothetical protein